MMDGRNQGLFCSTINSEMFSGSSAKKGIYFSLQQNTHRALIAVENCVVNDTYCQDCCPDLGGNKVFLNTCSEFWSLKMMYLELAPKICLEESQHALQWKGI